MAPLKLFILANTNHKEIAFNLLKKYIDQKRGQIINYRNEPLLEKLKSNSKFITLHQSNLSIKDLDPLVKTKTGSKTTIEKEEKEKFKIKLLDYFEKNKPYLNAQLSLNILADEIDLHPNKLSFFINEIMGINFNEFLNKYRLEHFKSIALNPKFNHITILGLAYDSGFNSKSVFNTYFKKTEGTTPSQWVKSQKN